MSGYVTHNSGRKMKDFLFSRKNYTGYFTLFDCKTRNKILLRMTKFTYYNLSVDKCSTIYIPIMILSLIYLKFSYYRLIARSNVSTYYSIWISFTLEGNEAPKKKKGGMTVDVVTMRFWLLIQKSLNNWWFWLK